MSWLNELIDQWEVCVWSMQVCCALLVLLMYDQRLYVGTRALSHTTTMCGCHKSQPWKVSMAKRLINENEEGRSGDLTSGAQPGRSSGRAHRGRSSGRHRRSRSRRERKDRGKTSRGRRESSRSRSPQGEEPGSESASEDMDPETQMSSLALQLGLNMATLKLKTKKQIKVEDLAPEAIIFVLAQPPGCTTKLPQLSTYTLHETGGELFALRQAAAARLKKKGEESKRSQQCEEMVCAEEAVLRKWKSRLCEIYEQLGAKGEKWGKRCSTLSFSLTPNGGEKPPLVVYADSSCLTTNATCGWALP